MEKKREAWQCGPVEGVPGLLQPVVHAFLQMRDEVHGIMENFPEELLWEKPAGVASPAFHIQHIRGVIERLFTYARKELLDEQQMHSLSLEGDREKTAATSKELIGLLDKQVDAAINELKQVKESSLTEARGIGRKQIPATLMGLYFHAAEHSMRHTGQLLVTVRVLKNS